jgi:tRNA-specific 2-thiouridylase
VFYDGECCLGGAIIERSDAPLGGWDATAAALTEKVHA